MADQADEPDDASTDRAAKSTRTSDATPAASSDGEPAGTAADAKELAERLADVHRRTEELAARVASFQVATSQLADTVAADPGESESPNAPATAEPKRRPSPVPRRDPEPEEREEPEGADEEREEPEGADEPVESHAPERPRPGPAPAGDKTEAEPAAAEEPKAAAEETTAAADKKAAKKDEKPAESKERKKRTGKGLPKWVRTLRSLVIAAVLIVAAAWALRTYVASPYYVPSASMEPTLHGCSNCNNDHVLVQKLSYDFHDPERSDIVVFENPGGKWAKAPDKDLIKRVIGVPGDRISIRDRHVYINGAKQAESYVNKACHGTAPLGLKNGYRVPKGHVFVMGDNRCNSEDSRMFGPVPIDKVIGKAFLIFWPIGRFGSP